MSFLDPLRRSSVKVTILAVVVGVQLSNVVSSILHSVAQAFQFFVYPARLPNPDFARMLKASLLVVASQAVLSAVVAAAVLWFMARLLSSAPGADE